MVVAIPVTSEDVECSSSIIGFVLSERVTTTLDDRLTLLYSPHFTVPHYYSSSSSCDAVRFILYFTIC